MLTQFFHMNKYNIYAQKLNCLYVEFPEYFTWHSDSKEWEPRKKQEVIGRIFSCRPSDNEKFYLKLMLMHVRKPISFKDLRTVNEVIFTTFREAAQMLGLIENDNTADMCIAEAAAYLMPHALRQLFATVLVFCYPKNPIQLWLKYQHFLSEDFAQNNSLTSTVISHRVLDIIDNYLYSMGKKLDDFFHVDKDVSQNFDDSLAKELKSERAMEDLLAIDQLNLEQKNAYDQILHHVHNDLPNSFFIDGPGGTGKTFLYRALLATIRSAGDIAIATATSGVAASLLPGGRTSHLRFKIPLEDNNIKSCSISKQSALAHLIKLAKLIIWDEATMAKRSIIEKFNEMLQDIMDSKLLFGGKLVVFGGDFRQTLPVILKSTKSDIIDASIVMSPLWNQLTKIKLQINMCALFDPHFSSWLLKIGNGIEATNKDNEIQIPSHINIPFTDDITSLNTLINMVFPNITDSNVDISLFVKRAILTTRNDFVHEINDVLINLFPGEETTYYSCDENTSSCVIPDQEDLFHCLTPQGLPPHKLTVKINSPIMLLRNINPTEGLCNGTRLLCKGFSKNVIYAEISVGTHAGKPAFIPRITLQSPHDDFSSIPFKRKQFPVRLCYTMTINKAQRQTLDFVGIYLKEPVFSHGQLYVALSRAKNMDQVKVSFYLSYLFINKSIAYKKLLNIYVPLEEKCTTLANLKPDIRNWFVRVFVSEKTPIRFLKWGRQQKLVFIDKENGTMQGIIYDQDVEQLDKLLQLYKTYYIGNAKVKEITSNAPFFASAKYQMLLGRSTYIRLADEEEQLPTDNAYQLTTFAQCPELADVSNKQISYVILPIFFFIIQIHYI
ncbi:ATP-dependent DNA helicase PIF1-like [Primulina tabacum]|uniref:ATP-dependent DNA helicase PIF1-like n=1 Tax=Primulina tabacum TaxID=48773 RepID=UPI003F5A7BCC